MSLFAFFCIFVCVCVLIKHIQSETNCVEKKTRIRDYLINGRYEKMKSIYNRIAIDDIWEGLLIVYWFYGLHFILYRV